ncbi:MAG: shikimate kinase [Acidimicrobiia bacterium]
MNLWLVGMMGSGKTTVGRLVAVEAGLTFQDVDLIVTQRAGNTIAELWKRDGEDAFRSAEAAIISELATATGAVVSTGGGAVLRESNRLAMRRSGTVVWLQASPEVLAGRVAGAHDRPLLNGGGRGRLAELLEGRRGAYQATAHHMVSTEGRTPAEVAEQVGRWL